VFCYLESVGLQIKSVYRKEMKLKQQILDDIFLQNNIDTLTLYLSALLLEVYIAEVENLDSIINSIIEN
jgi:hypothetical protein